MRSATTSYVSTIRNYSKWLYSLNHIHRIVDTVQDRCIYNAFIEINIEKFGRYIVKGTIPTKYASHSM